MKIAFQQFLGSSHSWALISQSLAEEFSKKNEVHLKSTNGYEHFPESLKPLIHEKLDNNYDMQLSYTVMKNFPAYLSNGRRNRFGIWSIEFDHYFPTSFAKYARAADRVLVPSSHTRQVFLDGGVPEELLTIVPHGINEQFYAGTSIYPLPKKFEGKTKILVNIAQAHLRKGIEGLLEMYGKAFSKKDEVVLIFKVPNRKPILSFDVNVSEVLANFKYNYPDHADIFQITHFIEDISSLYRACDIYFFPSKAEAFSLSPAEAIASGLITLTSQHGGALDFCTEDNSLLIPGKLEKADPRMLYWGSQDSNAFAAKCFAPDVTAGIELLRLAVKKQTSLREKFKNASNDLRKKYVWSKVAEQILELTK